MKNIRGCAQGVVPRAGGCINMKPGDMIEWVYKRTNELVVGSDEKFWSTLMKQWVPIGEKSLLISITDVEYTWLCSEGLFCALLIGERKLGFISPDLNIIPRVCT